MMTPAVARRAGEEEVVARGAVNPVYLDFDLTPERQAEEDLQAAVSTQVPDDNDVLALELKPTKTGQKGKELDPRKFNKLERKLFQKSSAENWQTHLDHQAVKVIYPDEAKLIPKERVFCIPSRFVHTWKDGARSRWVIPGHLDPDADNKAAGPRTDAPVVSQVALYTLLFIAARLQLDLGTFDIGSAFLTGKPNSRRLFVRPPREGLPGVPDGSLIELLKGVFGLKEAPRLWWLHFEQVLREAGFHPLRSATGVFVLRGSRGELVGVLAVHVDDGIWAGVGEIFRRAQTYVRKKLNMTKEKLARDNGGKLDFLGRCIEQKADWTVKVQQHKYVMEIRPMFIPAARRRTPKAKATEEERTKFLSLVQQLSWPARSSMPGLCFDVSDLQQQAANLTVHLLVRANHVVKMAVGMAKRGVGLCFPGGGGLDVGTLSVHDASFGQQPKGGSQQGWLSFFTTPRRKAGDMVVLTDWGSCKVRRVVHSTLAAEGASAAWGYDRMVHVRAIYAEMVHGWKADWRELLDTVPSTNLTDCQSLVDHCAKEGSLPQERRVALDIADLRSGIADGDDLVWTSTDRMAADCITKHMPDQSLLEQVLKTNRYNFTATGKPGKKTKITKDPMRKARV